MIENILTEKISIGISACMAGSKVRYNAKGWDMLDGLQREKSDFRWTPLCPEVMSGMGVPRPTIKLVGGNGDDFWEGKAIIKSKKGENLSESLRNASEMCLQTLRSAEINAFIYMEGSPTCGVKRTTLKNTSLGKPPGVFGSLLVKEEFFLIPSQELQSPVKWWDAKRRLVAFVWLCRQDLNSAKSVSEIWHYLKYLCQELNEKKARALGTLIAELNSESTFATFEQIKIDILKILREPTTLPKLKNALWKNYSFLRKNKNFEIPEINPPETLRNVTTFVKELMIAEKESKLKALLLGCSPIVYRPSR
ncbi:DUF523 domain-containing protein [Sediminitomix flava]|uniref:Uncharacterized protein YbbK (DUF523 family) n=1 Tax=Sediminitomix flava TaxID=379075 RepID=A0A315ZEF2_SEDFL|nr:DUF523 domain-containing protein [Sediminitomix flava]PWJ43911.1 uncharacterized protein YbbK (DUF523 family) [Sediminitomix flava]